MFRARAYRVTDHLFLFFDPKSLFSVESLTLCWLASHCLEHVCHYFRIRLQVQNKINDKSNAISSNLTFNFSLHPCWATISFPLSTINYKEIGQKDKVSVSSEYSLDWYSKEDFIITFSASPRTALAPWRSARTSRSKMRREISSVGKDHANKKAKTRDIVSIWYT